jgi:hypothetical protein
MIDVSSKVKCDMKELERFLKRLQQVDRYSVEYGYYPEQSHHSGMSLAEIAEIQEYGDDEMNIPARPFMQQTTDYMDLQYQSRGNWKQTLWDYLKGKGTITQFYRGIGLQGVDGIQTVINRQDFIDIADWWRQWKEKYAKHSDILRESGSLYENAKVKVVRGGDEK